MDVPTEYISAKKTALAVVLLILVAVVGLAPGILAEDAGFRGFMLLLSIGALALLPGGLGIACVPSHGKTYVLFNDSLEFAASRLPDFFFTTTSVTWGVAGVVGLVSSMQPGSYLSDSTGRFAPWILIPVAIFAIVDQIRRTLKPRGITLSEDGIKWRDLKHSGTVAWEDLERVELGAYKGMKRFYLHEYDGDLHIIEPSGLGSDPIVIAEVIEYFRTHPKDRNTLNDPREALALVVEPIPNPNN